MGKFRIAFTLLLLAALARAGGAAAGPVHRVNARQLVRAVDSALAGTARAAEAPRSGLDPRDPKVVPFWSALSGMRVRVARIQSALARRDGELFTLLDQGSADLGALRVAWARTGVKDGPAGEGLRIASASYRLLRANYGREGLRLRQGNPLSDAEQRHFQRVQVAQRRFADSLAPLRARSQRRGDAVTVAELDRFRAEAERIAWAPHDLDSYLNSLITSGEIRGEWEADAPYVRQSDAVEDFVVANEMVEDLYVESDIGHVFTVDLSGAVSHLDEETAVAGDAVQVFQSMDGPEVEFLPEERAEAVVLIEPEEIEPAEELPEATEIRTDSGEAAMVEDPESLDQEIVVEEIPVDAADAADPADPANTAAAQPAGDVKDEKPAPAAPPALADPQPAKPPIG